MYTRNTFTQSDHRLFCSDSCKTSTICLQCTMLRSTHAMKKKNGSCFLCFVEKGHACEKKIIWALFTFGNFDLLLSLFRWKQLGNSVYVSVVNVFPTRKYLTIYNSNKFTFLYKRIPARYKKMLPLQSLRFGKWSYWIWPRSVPAHLRNLMRIYACQLD